MLLSTSTGVESVCVGEEPRVAELAAKLIGYLLHGNDIGSTGRTGLVRVPVYQLDLLLSVSMQSGRAN